MVRYELFIKNKVPRPAAYATVWWKFKCSCNDNWSQFQLKNSCVVEKTHPATYYALLGFHGESFEGMDDGGRGSGGYGGIQVKEDGRTLLIFSLWDGPIVKTKCVRIDFIIIYDELPIFSQLCLRLSIKINSKSK